MNTDGVTFNFYSRVDSLCQDIEGHSSHWGPHLSDEKDRAFLGTVASRLFFEALKLLEGDKKLAPPHSSSVDILGRRCHKFQALSNKLHSLQSKILTAFEESDQPIKTYGSLRKIDQRILWLREQALMQSRLPIHYGSNLKTYEQSLRSVLGLVVITPKSLQEVEKEAFHLLANHLQGFEGLEKTEFEGRSTSLALITHIDLVQETIENNSQNRSVLNALQGALQLAMKLDFALVNHTNKHDLSVYGEKIQKFISDFSIENKSLRRKLLLHDISWDCLETIQSLKNEEFVFFPLGTKTHHVMVKIECHIKAEQTTYTYQLFNTGYGCREHHKIQSFNQQLYVKPLKIIGIQLCGLNYTFWNEVFTCSLIKVNIHLLYELQDRHLIDLGGGRKVKDSADSFYPLQKFGTCSFNSSEMALFSHLDINDQKKMELVKASYALRKQLKVVKYRRLLIFKCKNPAIRLKLLNQLRQSQLLLQKLREQLRECLYEWNKINRQTRRTSIKI